MSSTRVALVAGANGIIGRKLISHLRTLDGWEVLGLSRRGGSGSLAVDLLDPAGTRAALAGVGATHLFYAAYQDRPTWAELVAPNAAMLENLVNGLDEGPLEHVSLMQGYKVYGAHLGPFKTPARETDAGQHMPPEFNAVQQKFLQRRAAAGGWSWSAIRPSVVGGTTLGNPMNLALVIAVYASISKELGLPLRFPGKLGAYDSLLEMTDAQLLAEGTVWAATSSQNEAFNIANGDLFRWRELWPKLAAYFDLEVASPLQLPLTTVMADKEPLWTEMAAKHGLAASYADVSSWAFGDFVFSWDYDMFADTSKSRRAGFHSYVDTEQMFYRLFDELRRDHVIPGR
ncbi:SDR family oxidoreductase [Amycolatopsis rubida]|uniref:Nucleoside-diphosphate-sugar epimerase n=1 Tax=Amycolatopsis rubida TaxID=112413 RepID=A0A1I5Z704_9PSEU|nr:SDR family oxidoreductase [Amycolatopsis rubida]SFQ51897.1 Nucleoside-diphosphate-sugar epimerase [Amycolatopsis rubida]